MFDVYVFVAGKHVHYIRANEEFEGNRLTSLKTKGVKKLFIPFQSEENYLAYLDVGLNSLSEPNQSLEEKSTIAKDTMTTEAENIQHNLESEQGFRATEIRLSKLAEFIASDKGMLKTVLDATGCSPDDTQHGASVAFLTLGLANKIGGFSTRDLFELSIASLLHDIGKEKLNAPKDKSYKLEKHPVVAIDMLSNKKFITPSVLRLIADHEEKGEGEGYPDHKRLSKLPISSQVFNLCNFFDRLSMEKGVPHAELIKTFAVENRRFFNPAYITLLEELLASQ